MRGASPPLRCVVLVIGGWICLRAATLMPGWIEEDAVARPAIGVASARREPSPNVTGLSAMGRSFGAQPLLSDVRSFARISLVPRSSRSATRIILTRAGGPAPFDEDGIGAISQRVASAAEAETALMPTNPVRSFPASMPSPRPFSRWSSSAWAFVRRGGGGQLAAGGTLGGSQTGARLSYRLSDDERRPLALSARIYAPLEGKGAEAALGVEWQPVAGLPARLLAERRQRVGKEGRSAFALMAHGGVSDRPVAGGLRLDAYAQSGIVGARSRDLFVDGSARLSKGLGDNGTIAVGAGIWGAAQPGLSRVDIGPQVSLRLNVSGAAMRLAVDYRLRVAGDAAPGSGPALTLATDF